MALSRHAYFTNSVYRDIANRLSKRHQINIAEHIAEMEKVAPSIGAGFDFKPVSSDKLIALLKLPRFAHDDRAYLCDRLAAAVTHGEGYREVGVPSLHFQIAPDKVNVHLDTYGFVAIGPDGTKYFNPDLIQHIADDLGAATIAQFAGKLHPKLGSLIGRFHPILPNSMNGYKLAVGGRFVVAKGKGWSLGLDVTKSLSGETRKGGTLELLHW
ncbi:MAG: hypothetical protein R2724_11660 [Bryobacterales bacterium]